MFLGRGQLAVLALLVGCGHHVANAIDAGSEVDADNGFGVDALDPRIHCTDGCDCTVLATSQSRPVAVAADADNVYWLDFGSDSLSYQDGAVFQAPRSGGLPVKLADGQVYATGMVIDDHNIYWTTFFSGPCDSGCTPSSGTVNSVPIGGGAVVPIATGQPTPGPLVIRGTTLYWLNEGTNSNDGAIMSASLPGGAPTPVVTGINNPFGLAVDADTVYWTSNSDNTVMSMPLVGGPKTMLASGQDNIYQVVVDDTNAYWWAYSYTDSPSIHYIMSVPKTGGTPVPLVSDALSAQMTIDSSGLYWADNDNGMIHSVPATGGAAATVCDMQGNVQSVATTADAVFWGVDGNGNAGPNSLIITLAK